MKKTIRQMSNNELSEAINLASEIERLIEKEYLHVNTPKSVKTAFNNFSKAVIEEYERRENQD